MVVLFDDVLASGKHYRVAKTRIREVFPGQGTLGIRGAPRAQKLLPSTCFPRSDSRLTPSSQRTLMAAIGRRHWAVCLARATGCRRWCRSGA